MAMNKKRMELLKKNGVNTEGFFSLGLDSDVDVKDLAINIDGVDYSLTPLEKEELDEIEKEIIESGYVKNTKLHRRWVMAQTFKMLTYYSEDRTVSKDSWNKYIENNFKYEYQFDMLIEEYRVQSILMSEDMDCYKERAMFFPVSVARDLCYDYIIKFMHLINSSPKEVRRSYKDGKESLFTVCYLGHKTATLESLSSLLNLLNNINSEICKLNYLGNDIKSTDLKKVSDLLYRFRLNIVSPNSDNKCSEWVQAYRASGAYYTLKNMVMFHKVDLKEMADFNYDNSYIRHAVYSCDDYLSDVEKSMNYLKDMTQEYYEDEELWRLHFFLIELIESTNFDFEQSIKENS